MFAREIYADWWLFYQSVGVEWRFSDATPHIELPRKSFPIPFQAVLVLKQVPKNQVNEIFRGFLKPYAYLLSAPGSIGCKPYEFEDLVTTSIRDASAGDYTIALKRHFTENNGVLKRIDHLDPRVTVEEAMLYHSFMIWKHGDAYMKLQYADFHPCEGTPGKRGLRFDLQDIKVCLD